MTSLLPLQDATSLFLDSAPILYFLEGHAAYSPPMDELFRLVQAGRIKAVTTTLTLTECLLGRPAVGGHCARLIARNLNTLLLPIDRNILYGAGRLRGRHGLTHGDALQVAAAMDAGCSAFLTNDRALQRIDDIPVLLLDDLRRHG